MANMKQSHDYVSFVSILSVEWEIILFTTSEFSLKLVLEVPMFSNAMRLLMVLSL